MLAGVSGPVAVDAVIDSVSVVTTFQRELEKQGIIFARSARRSASTRPREAVSRSVVPVTDNYYATLNSAVFTDGRSATCRRRALPDGA